MKDRVISYVGSGVTELGNDDVVRNIFTLQGFHFIVFQQLLQGLFVHFCASQRVGLKVDIKIGTVLADLISIMFFSGF